MEDVYNKLEELCMEQKKSSGTVAGVTAAEIAEKFNLHRSNISGDLNRLFVEGRIKKVKGRPVLYKIDDAKISSSNNEIDIFDRIIGTKYSLKNIIQQAKAAIMYPPKGLHTLLLGETGTGKSMFAEKMYQYAKDIGKIKKNAPFISFNCADYFNNPQLLVSQLFGVKKGAYTGAENDKPGIVEEANNGVLFLDEIHRLPPEGQEMLFYLIDKGIYQRLGEVGIHHTVNVFIICATTENAESSLLKTFLRRIPMIIKLPSLSERSYEERYELILSFLKNESESIKSDISATSEVINALLLYDCPNNIGQLKSDIKLSCAKAFFGFMVNKSNMVHIDITDLPSYVKSGLFKLKEEKSKISQLIDGKDIVLGFNRSENYYTGSEDSFNFYDFLEKKRDSLKDKGIDEEEVNMIIELDIEKYFRKYILNIKNENLEELYKVVEKNVVDIVHKFLDYAGTKLEKSFDNKIFHGLCLHISSSIKRIADGKKIINHQLQNIKKNYPREFEVSKVIRQMLEEEFNIKVPEDEIGFIAMFLYVEDEPLNEKGKVAVVVAMHGESAATSIADVANRLLGEKHAVGYNMPLDQKPETAFENLINLVRLKDEGRGAVLLVDMGSLVLLGDMIYEKTGIPVKTIEMVSTPMVLEAARKALLYLSMEEIYDSVSNISPYTGKVYLEPFNLSKTIKKNVVITACMTGEGAAVKLKSIVETKFGLINKDVDIICIDISNKKEFKKKILKINEERNVIAVVSAVDPEERDILHISTSDLFDSEKEQLLKKKEEILNNIIKIINMVEVINSNVQIDASKFINTFKHFYLILLSYNIFVEGDMLIGLILHIACAVEYLLKGEKLYKSPIKDTIISENEAVFKAVKNAVTVIERDFNITITEDECANIVRIICV